MPKPKLPFTMYAFQDRAETYQLFKAHQHFVGVTDNTVLTHVAAAKVIALPGWQKYEAAICTRPSGFEELWVNPARADYREAHEAFLEYKGILITRAQFESLDSDHAYPKSAASQCGLVRMNLIDKGTNRSHGGGREKRFTHRSIDGDGFAPAHLLDLAKAMGIRLIDSKDPVKSILAIPQILVGMGIADAADLSGLTAAAKGTVEWDQDQDTAYAVKTGQYNP